MTFSDHQIVGPELPPHVQEQARKIQQAIARELERRFTDALYAAAPNKPQPQGRSIFAKDVV